MNNFADLSSDLLEDLKEELETAKEHVPEESRAEIEDISGDLSGNLERIVHHGKRASSIVYGMLEHSRKEGGERRPHRDQRHARGIHRPRLPFDARGGQPVSR